MFDEEGFIIFELIIIGSVVVWMCICGGVNHIFSGSITKKRLREFVNEWSGDRTMIYYIVEEHNHHMRFSKDKVSVDELLKG